MLEKKRTGEIIQTTSLLRSVRILGRDLKSWGDLPSLNLQWKTINYCWCEKLVKEFDNYKIIKIETLNTLKQERPNRTETQNTEKRNSTKATLISESKSNKEVITKAMTENKTFLSFHRWDWKKVMAETDKINKLSTNISAGNITELKRANLCRCETSQWLNRCFPKEPEQKYKTGMGNYAWKTGKEIATTSGSAKKIKTYLGMLEWNSQHSRRVCK